MLPSLLVSTRLPRRLLSAVLALGVLTTLLGWGHPSCDGTGTQRVAASAAASHAGMAGAHDEARPGADAAEQAPSGCPDHDRHDGRGAAECAVVAHCAVGVVASAVVVPASQVLRLEPAVDLSASRPLDASYEPDSPPPKG